MGEDNFQDEANQDNTAPEEQQTKTFTEADIAELTQKFEQEKQAAIDEALLKAKMTKNEAAEYDYSQKIKQLEDREQNLNRKELEAETKALLAENGLPAEMLPFLVSGNKESTQKNIGAFKTAYDKAVQEGITKAIAGKTPIAGATAVSGSQNNFFQTILGSQAKRK